MANTGLLLGIKNGKREIIAEGDPRLLRIKFKTEDFKGFEAVEVYESSLGRTRKKSIKQAPVLAQKVAKKSAASE
tara:strand:+ start:450 stop:674 length:225 start_codon:yes stop_codon:yes gene_type:complete